MKRIIIMTIVCVFVFSGFASAGLMDGLVGYYIFNGNADDLSGNQNHGIVNGATLTHDRFGNPDAAYFFDGIDDFIRIEPSATNSSFEEISISAWVNIAGSPGRFGGIVTRWNQDLTNGAYYAIWEDVIRNPGKIVAGSYEHCCLRTDRLFSEILDRDEWISVVYIISPNLGQEILYINGQLADVNTRTGPIRTSDLPFIIGADIQTYQQDDYWRFFHGFIDDVRIYNRALSETEVLELHNAPNPVLESAIDLHPDICEVKTKSDSMPNKQQGVFINAFIEFPMDELRVGVVDHSTVALSLDGQELSMAESIEVIDNILKVGFYLDMSDLSTLLGLEAKGVNVAGGEVKVKTTAPPAASIDCIELTVSGDFVDYRGSFTAKDAVRIMLKN